MRAARVAFACCTRWVAGCLIALGALPALAQSSANAAGAQPPANASGESLLVLPGGLDLTFDEPWAGPTSRDRDVPMALAIRPEVLSSRADMVSGGDVLVRVPVPAPYAPGDIEVRLGDTDITRHFVSSRDGQLIARLTGLQVGSAQLEVRVNGRRAGALTLVNHPISGPLFAGPREKPFICQTDEFALPGGTRLGAPLDADCSITTRVDYYYRPSGAGGPVLRPLPAGDAPPADVATLEREGKTIRYIVRLQTGTANRAIYQIAALHDPYADPEVTPFHSWPGWNNRLIFAFGGGCNGGWYRQGASVGDVLNSHLIEQGYAIASSSLNVFGNNCNEVLAAETMAMVKARFITTFGVPLFTIGWGCSGGSYQQHFIADNYPGLLDGIIPGCSFPDLLSTVTMLADLHSMRRYFAREDAASFSPEQQRAVAGVANLATLANQDIERGVKRIAATGIVPEVLPRNLLFDAKTNPGGVRVDVFSHGVNYFGRDPTSGVALRPLDNVGVQYGLQALKGGVITFEQFLDLNEKIGGYDEHGLPTEARSYGAPQALAAAYGAGLLTGRGGLASIPIIDYRAYTDDLPNGDMHLRYHSFAMRSRLAGTSAKAGNQVMFVEDARYGLYSTASPLLRRALAEMDAWLTAIAADHSQDPPAEKVLRHRPAGLTDVCMTREAEPVPVAEDMNALSGRCASLYPAPSSPHVAAGAPLAGDVLKCRLHPLDAALYPEPPSPEQWERLQRIFPQGVCDWSRPGVGQDERAAPWMRFPLRSASAAPGPEPAPALTPAASSDLPAVAVPESPVQSTQAAAEAAVREASTADGAASTPAGPVAELASAAARPRAGAPSSVLPSRPTRADAEPAPPRSPF
ncbi:hypothetical protein FOZ76_24980 [Verticiella sediminum]|uniref:DUF6351 domain-containing protein n=1 Tax=Verticiella sediminum TaxID=1247510 RepID=A0A556A7M4_9BURK|nr:DUF6351 family protein [Verticiella sediminum]TSH88891.1 hypothetical protein FOZ76_24980 [Verticiella sediminum]